jgi:Skp family chaperone for outer membrane proteins
MKYQKVSVACAALALLVSSATIASAQSAPKKAAAARPATASAAGGGGAALPMGPTIPGFCVLGREAIIGASVSGKFAISRLGQLKQQAEAELASERATLETDVKAFQAQRATLPADQVQSREASLNARAQAFQRKAQLRTAELQQTQQKAFGTIYQAADPIVRQVFVQRSCSVLLDGANVISASQAMDITPAVIQGLDGKLQSFSFEREHIDPNAAAAAPR